MMCGNICTQVSFQKFPSKHTHFHVPENKTDACLEYIYLSAGMLGDRHIRSHTFIHVHFVAISPASVRVCVCPHCVRAHIHIIHSKAAYRIRRRLSHTMFSLHSGVFYIMFERAWKTRLFDTRDAFENFEHHSTIRWHTVVRRQRRQRLPLSISLSLCLSSALPSERQRPRWNTGGLCLCAHQNVCLPTTTVKCVLTWAAGVCEGGGGSWITCRSTFSVL